MSAVLFIRHGPTEWNSSGRIQGQTDIPLSPAGRDEVRGWRLPREFDAFDWYSSPLLRTRETAALLGARLCRFEPRLMEADWGKWEGWSLEQLRASIGDVFAAMEAAGLDLAPPGGETPRRVRERLASWLKEIAPSRRPAIAVCHAGIVRAAYSLATGWDMRDKAPLARPHSFAHLYNLGADGSLVPCELNIALMPVAAGAAPVGAG